MVLVLGELPHELVAPHAYATRVVGIGAFSYQCYIHVPGCPRKQRDALLSRVGLLTACPPRSIVPRSDNG